MTAAATGALGGAAIKGVTGEPTLKSVGKAVRGEPIVSDKYKKSINYPKAKKSFNASRSSGKGVVESLQRGARDINFKRVGPQAARGAAIGAVGAGLGLAGINALRYQAGKSIANADSSELNDISPKRSKNPSKRIA